MRNLSAYCLWEWSQIGWEGIVIYGRIGFEIVESLFTELKPAELQIFCAELEKEMNKREI